MHHFTKVTTNRSAVTYRSHTNRYIITVGTKILLVMYPCTTDIPEKWSLCKANSDKFCHVAMSSAAQTCHRNLATRFRRLSTYWRIAKILPHASINLSAYTGRQTANAKCLLDAVKQEHSLSSTSA